MQLKASAAVVLFYKSFWVFTRRHFLVRNQRFETTCVSHVQGLEIILDYLETLNISQLVTLRIIHITYSPTVHCTINLFPFMQQPLTYQPSGHRSRISNVGNTRRHRTRTVIRRVRKTAKSDITFVMSVRPSVRPHGTTWLPLNGNSRDLKPEYFSKICPQISYLIKNLTRTTGALHEDLCTFMISR